MRVSTTEVINDLWKGLVVRKSEIVKADDKNVSELEFFGVMKQKHKGS